MHTTLGIIKLTCLIVCSLFLSRINKLFIFTLLCLTCTPYSYSQVQLSGWVHSDTTLLAANGPYYVSDSLVIDTNIELTLEPGVWMLFGKKAKVKVLGALTAIGNLEDSIRFSADSTAQYPDPMRGWWSGIHILEGGQATLEFCVGEYADDFLRFNKNVVYHHFEHCVFSTNRKACTGANDVIVDFTECVFSKNGRALDHLGTDSEALNCSFIGNIDAVRDVDHVKYCYFKNNFQGLYAGRTVIGNTFEGNRRWAIWCWFQEESDVVKDNLITDNRIGLMIGYLVDDFGKIVDNTICDNRYLDVYIGQSQDADLRDNCWCTIKPSEIYGDIMDGRSDTNKGLAIVLPTSQENCETFPVGTTGGIESQSDVSAYPNPFNNQVSLQGLSGDYFEVSFYDLQGRVVISKTLSANLVIDTSPLTAGVYIVILSNSSEVLFRRSMIKSD